MVSWPTGGGQGRSLITLISTANATTGEDGDKERESNERHKWANDKRIEDGEVTGREEEKQRKE